MNDFLLVFNHHSLPFSSREQADSAIVAFLKLTFRAQRLGLQLILVDEPLDSKWFRIELAPGYFWQDWYNKHKKRNSYKNTIQAFLSIQTRQPFFSTDDTQQGVDLVEVRLPDESITLSALKAALWHKGYLLSFASHWPWNDSPILAVSEQLDKNDGEIIIQDVQLINLHHIEVLRNIEGDIRQRQKMNISSGKGLYEQRKILYPELELCGKTQSQLTIWPHSHSTLEQVIESLAVLNKFCEQWQQDIFPDYSHQTLRELGLNHQVSGESTTVKQTPKLLRSRQFYLPTGKKVDFENHIKLSNGIRLHFYPEAENRLIYIGYIGSHLPLA